MRPNNLIAGAALLIALAGIPVLAATPEELAALRQEAIAAARDTGQKERIVAALENEIRLLASDADARQRGLDETRAEQARLLGMIERVARHPPERRAVFAEAPIDELRSEKLRQAAMPALRTQARALSNEISRIATLRQQIAAKQSESDAARQALGGERERLAGVVLRRTDLTRQMVPEDSGAETRVEGLARGAAGVAELIKRAEAAADRRDKDLLARSRAAQRRTKEEATAEFGDPTRPNELRAFDPPQSALVTPVSGTLIGRFGEADAAGGAGDGVTLSALAGAAIVAPFDGRLVYAGPFGDFELILIFRHGNLYNSIVAGLGRVDIKLDQWVLAGEPVGAVPDAPPPDASPPAGEDRTGISGRRLYFELQREGRPVDPQPWLASGADGHDRRNGDQRVLQ